MPKSYEIIKTILKNNTFKLKSKRLNLEIMIDYNQKDLINVQHSIYNSSKATIFSKELQEFLKNAYHNAVASKKIDIPWVITATFNLPKFEINQKNLPNSSYITEINDLKNKIIKAGITIKNDETYFETKLSLKEICENFNIENSNIKELLNDCLKIPDNNFEKIKQQSNLDTKENKTYNYHSVQL